MKRETFEQQLRDRLDGYESQVPDNLWEEIDARLSSDSPTQEKHKSYPASPSEATPARKHSRVIPLWAKITAAAACIAAAVAFFMGQKSSSPSPLGPVGGDTPELVVNGQDDQSGIDTPKLAVNNHEEQGSSGVNTPEQSVNTPDTHPGTQASRLRNVATDTPASPTESKWQENPHVAQESMPQEPNLPLVAQSDGDASVSPAEDHTPSTNNESPQNIPEYPPINHHLTHHESPSLGGGTGEVSLSLYADNIFGRGGDASAMYMSPALADTYNYAFDNAPAGYRAAPQLYRLAGYEERSVHYRPVVFGLSAALPLSGRWAVQTGLTYNWLSSEFIHEMRGTTITDKQSLQYLGIPLAASYQVWNKGAFSLYAAAGGSLLINTSARLKTDGVKSQLRHDRLQWSMSAVVGAQYEFIPSFSLYVEPGVTYYPDNGSDMQNFYKDKPFNPSLQFGVRYRISK